MSVATRTAVRARQLKEILGSAFQAPINHYIPPFITGIPGLGKTNMVMQVCNELGIECKVIRPIQHETVEFTGVPMTYQDAQQSARAAWAAFDDLLPTDPEFNGVIFLDEITQLATNEQKVIASLMDKEGVAGRRIPKNARFVLAGNRQEDRAGASKMISIIESRTFQVELQFSSQDWLEWAEANDLHETILGFCRMKPSEFVSFDPSRSINPLPRTWEKVDQAIKYMGSASNTVISGLVGPGMAAEFKAFRDHYEIMHGALERIVTTGTAEPPEELIKRNGGEGENKLKTDALSVQHALIGACTQYAREHADMPDEHLTNLLTYASKSLPASLGALFMHRIMCVGVDRSGSSVSSKLTMRVGSHPVWQKFISEHSATISNWNGK